MTIKSVIFIVWYIPFGILICGLVILYLNIFWSLKGIIKYDLFITNVHKVWQSNSLFQYTNKSIMHCIFIICCHQVFIIWQRDSGAIWQKILLCRSCWCLINLLTSLYNMGKNACLGCKIYHAILIGHNHLVLRFMDCSYLSMLQFS